MPLPQHWKILITGITSIHGWPIYRRLIECLPATRLFGICPPKTRVLIGPNVRAACITDREQLEQIRKEFSPTHVFHCAGVCDLDVCEDRPNWAYDINVNGTGAICSIFADLPIFYMSTDLVFSGENPPPTGYAEIHPPDPVSVAGKTFSQAETQLDHADHACIVRLGLPLGDSITGDKGARSIGSKVASNANVPSLCFTMNSVAALPVSKSPTWPCTSSPINGLGSITSAGHAPGPCTTSAPMSSNEAGTTPPFSRASCVMRRSTALLALEMSL